MPLLRVRISGAWLAHPAGADSFLRCFRARRPCDRAPCRRERRRHLALAFSRNIARPRSFIDYTSLNSTGFRITQFRRFFRLVVQRFVPLWPLSQANVSRRGNHRHGEPKCDVAHVSVEFRSRCGSPKGTRAAGRRPFRMETVKRHDLHNRKTLREGVGRNLGRSPETAEIQPPRYKIAQNTGKRARDTMIQRKA